MRERRAATKTAWWILTAAAACATVACGPVESDGDVVEACSVDCGGVGGSGGSAPTGPVNLRIAQFNVRELSTDKLVSGLDEQATAAAEVIGRVSPDIIGINELQYDIEGMPYANMPGVPPQQTTLGSFDNGAANARRLADRVTAAHPDAIYEHTLTTLGNSGFYWSGDTGGNSSFVLRGWGEWEGRHNTGILSRYPILTDQVRIITDFAWSDLPGNLIAQIEQDTGVVVPEGFPLFEKSLNVIPIQVGEEVLYLVMLHPVPPAFEAINPYRNHDELRGLSLFLNGALPGIEPLPEGAKFVVIGDLNADPEDGDGSIPGAIQQVIEHPALVPYFPVGAGFKGVNGEYNTYLSGCGLDDGTVVDNPADRWQMQLDYVLPSTTIGEPSGGAVFWPDFDQERTDHDLACRASDHHLAYIDIEL